MLIILIILIAIFLRNVSNDQLRRFLYLLAILYVGTYLYDYYNVKPTNLLDVSINVEPLEPTLIYDKENVKLYDIADDLTYKSKKNFTLKHFIERINLYNEEQFEYNIKKILME